MENLFLPKEAVGQLFDLQGEDALLGQLQHQIKTLPEREKLMSLNQIRNEVEGLIDVRKNEGLEEVKKEKRLELELSSIETSLTEADEKLYSGVITTEKEVKSLQGEILHLKDRQDVLESDLLETLSLLEEINSNIDKCNSELETQNDEIQTVESALNVVENELTQKVAEAKSRREGIVKILKEEILTCYETHREQFPSNAVVRFDGPNCNGCYLTMSAMETDRIKGLEVGALTECSECGRLVVR